MRQGIRDFLLMMTVLAGGLSTNLAFVVADDQQPAPTAPTTAASDAEKPASSAEQESEPAKTADNVTGDTPQDPPEEPEGGGDHAATSDEEGSDDAGADDATAGHETPDQEGDDGAHHDLTDLGHQNATPAIADPSEIKSDLAIWTVVVFLCLLTLLGKFAWGPIMDGLDRREASIATAIDEAKQAAAKGAEQLKEYEAKLAAVGDETREILAQARKDAEAAGERIVAEAQEAAGRERDKAIADISAAKNSALQDITERSVDLAVSMAGRMIQRQMTPGDRAGLIREALDQLPNQN